MYESKIDLYFTCFYVNSENTPGKIWTLLNDHLLKYSIYSYNTLKCLKSISCFNISEKEELKEISRCLIKLPGNAHQLKYIWVHLKK